MKKLLITLGVITMLAISTIANALTGYIDPNGDGATQQWQNESQSGAPFYTHIDGATRGDTSSYNPDGSEYINAPFAAGNGKIAIFDMTSIAGAGSVTSVEVWGWFQRGTAGNTATPSIFMAGGWIAGANFSITSSGSWASRVFNGNWTQADLDAIQIKLVSVTTATGITDCELYGKVTYTAGGGGVTRTGKVIMISDDGEGAPLPGYNYDYVSVYPPEQSDTYVKATGVGIENQEPYRTTDPSSLLIGAWSYAEWSSDMNEVTNQCFHIDLGSAKTIVRIYYENGHNNGSSTIGGVQNFTFYGSNTAGDFSDLVYADTGTWVQLTTSQSTFDQHVAANQPDPKYITVTNTTPYQYYGFKFADIYSGTGYMHVRRIELQTAR